MIFALLLLQTVSVEDGSARWRDPPACWDGPQSELTHCAWVEYKAADEDMHSQLLKTQVVLQRLDSKHSVDALSGNISHSEALNAGQTAWLAYRVQHCKIYRADGGSMAPMLEGICLRDVTRERTKLLASLTLNPATGNPYFEE